MLDGMFSFVLLDTRDDSFIAARDGIGITPLYMGWGRDGMLYMLLFVFSLIFSHNSSQQVYRDIGIFFK